jgi:hypothetical protein
MDLNNARLEESIPTRPLDRPLLTMREPLDLLTGTESNPIVIGDDPAPSGTESNPIVIGDDITSPDSAFGHVVNHVNEDIQAEQPRLQLPRLQLLRLQLPRLQVPPLQVPPANELRAYQFKLKQIAEQLADQLQADTERQAEDLESDTETEIMTTPDYWENLIDEDVPISADGDVITETYPILAPPESSVHKDLEGPYAPAGPPAHSLNLDHKLSEPTSSESFMKCRYVGKETHSEIYLQGQRGNLSVGDILFQELLIILL